MASPVRLDYHASPHFDLIGLLCAYKWATPGVKGADNGTNRLDLDNEPQPDVMLYVDSDKGGKATISADGYFENAPELIAEVAASSVSIDTKIKFKVYRRNGVQEYIIWRVLDHQIDWFTLHEGEYKRLPLDDRGLYRSQVFPGLWLDPAALIRGDIPAVQSALQQGLARPEHQAFVARLAAAQRSAGPGGR